MDIEKSINKISSKIKTEKINFKLEQVLKFPITEEKIKNLDNSLKYIYVITGQGTENINYDDIKNKYEEIKLPRINTNNNNNQYIYIGTSKNIHTRLKQHLIKNSNKSTYSLHMYLWNKNEAYFKNVKIYLYSFQCDLDLVKVIESRLFKEYKPLFGSGVLR